MLAPVLDIVLNPESDDGASKDDAVTGVRTPEFVLKGGDLLTEGGSVRLLSPTGEVLNTMQVSAADVVNGAVNVGPGPLDDGEYVFLSQILDAAGNVVGQAPVKVTVVTDLDGIAPSVELAAYAGDFNDDGVLDWQQHSVAMMPLRSFADYAQGKAAPLASFGALMAGTLNSATGEVELTAGSQLKDMSLTDVEKPLPEGVRAASAVFNFTVGAEAGVDALPDLAPEREGLQTRVVIDLGTSGMISNDFLKLDVVTGEYYSFLDDQNLATNDDGATLVDVNGDGRVDRIVITLTDGARGDDDGIANGVFVDPGLLAFDTAPPDQVYSIRQANGELVYTADLVEAKAKALGAGNVFEGVVFDSMADVPGAQQVSAWYQPFTRDTTFAFDSESLPYACYGLTTGAGFLAAKAGVAAVNIHLYQNSRGQTELMSTEQALSMKLAENGYADRGAQFSTTQDHAFKFDAEGYLIANHDNSAVQALVLELAGKYQSTGDAGFIEAVEQSYFEQIAVVGVAHGAAATAGDLNALFGTSFAI